MVDETKSIVGQIAADSSGLDSTKELFSELASNIARDIFRSKSRLISSVF
jgi:hypothetical protein